MILTPRSEAVEALGMGLFVAAVQQAVHGMREAAIPQGGRGHILHARTCQHRLRLLQAVEQSGGNGNEGVVLRHHAQQLPLQGAQLVPGLDLPSRRTGLQQQNAPRPRSLTYLSEVIESDT
jgi:hypothetical protein